MRIGHYVSVVAGQKGFENNVSGHIQVPLHAMRLLRDAGHEVHLVTNEFGPDRSLPNCLPEGVPVHHVVDVRNRGGILERTGDQGRGVKPAVMWRQARQMVGLAKEHGFDILHCYGFNRTAHLAGGLRLVGLPCPTVATVFGVQFPERGAFLTRRLWRRVGAVVTATEYVQRQLQEQGIPSRLVRHGVIRDITAELGTEQVGEKHRVLFWRDPSEKNGADVVMEVYDKLAPRYPDISFDMAVRLNWEEVPGLAELPQRHENVHVHRFPYEGDITLPRLMLESMCVVMPFRVMSIDPQLVIAESLASGVPVVATELRSNPELITPGVNGDLVPLDDVSATATAIERMLDNPEQTLEMGRHAAESLPRTFTWDSYVDEITAVYGEL